MPFMITSGDVDPLCGPQSAGDFRRGHPNYNVNCRMMTVSGVLYHVLGLADEKVHPVEVVHFADAGIHIQEEQVQTFVFFLKSLCNPSRRNLVGDAAKGLQAQHV